MVCTDLKARIDPIVTASDRRCESGGGATYASRLSRLGEEELERLMEEDFPEGLSLADDFRDMSQKIVVIDLFGWSGRSRKGPCSMPRSGPGLWWPWSQMLTVGVACAGDSQDWNCALTSEGSTRG